MYYNHMQYGKDIWATAVKPSVDDNMADLLTKSFDGPRYIVPTGSVIVATGRYIVPAEEHLAIQRESKARTTLLQSILDDHIVDFQYMDDARDIWNAVKARFVGNAESKNTRKIYAEARIFRVLN
nr:xylulose kinase-1 [Tanacetum cinerariifolium]